MERPRKHSFVSAPPPPREGVSGNQDMSMYRSGCDRHLIDFNVAGQGPSSHTGS